MIVGVEREETIKYIVQNYDREVTKVSESEIIEDQND